MPLCHRRTWCAGTWRVVNVCAPPQLSAQFQLAQASQAKLHSSARGGVAGITPPFRGIGASGSDGDGSARQAHLQAAQSSDLLDSLIQFVSSSDIRLRFVGLVDVNPTLAKSVLTTLLGGLATAAYGLLQGTAR